MALTKTFRDTVRARAQKDSVFRRELLREALNALVEGDLDTGKAILRNYINATMGFEQLASRIHTPSKSLHRMLGPSGNPRAENLFQVIAALQKSEKLSAKVVLR
jgi:DNA-binding phage protein